ncbi:MAG: ATP synthase subunit I [Deferribacterales bacterium]
MKIENKILILSLIFCGILYTVSTFIFEPAFCNGVPAGFVLGAVNFRYLAKGVRRVTEEGRPGLMVLWGMLRLLVSGVFVWYCIVPLKLNVTGMLVGLTILPVCVPIVAIYNNLKGKNDGTPA